MFQLDEKFLDEIGLNELPEEQTKPFLQPSRLHPHLQICMTLLVLLTHVITKLQVAPLLGML